MSSLGDIARESDAAFVIDERESGCGASGKSFWASNGASSDYLVFGGRTQAEGFYSTTSSKAHAKHCLGGDALKLLQLQVILGAMPPVERVAQVGSALHSTIEGALRGHQA
jgi:4-aminobutyrate aminotransferase-like enzyme